MLIRRVELEAPVWHGGYFPAAPPIVHAYLRLSRDTLVGPRRADDAYDFPSVPALVIGLVVSLVGGGVGFCLYDQQVMGS